MLRDEVRYRVATLEDAAELAAFGAQAFVDAWERGIDAGAVARHVLHTFSPELQRRELIEPGAWSVLGDRDGEIVGAVLLKPAPNPAAHDSTIAWVEIQRFCVARMYWQTGISADLMAATLKSIRSRGGESVWLQVWERASRAIGFYRKWGLVKIGQAPGRTGTEAQSDLVMARTLRAVSTAN